MRVLALWQEKRSVSLLLLSLLLILLVSIFALTPPFTSSKAPLLTEIVDRGDIEKTVLATGILKPSLQVAVGAQVNGQLKKLYVQQGERVKAGQLLAEIDPRLQQSEVRKSEAELQSAMAQKQAALVNLNLYQLELKRQRRLARDGSGIRSSLEQALAQYETQQAQVMVHDARIVQAEMALETAKANLGYTQILAPIDGEVLGIVTKEGQTVVSSQSAPTILVLANVDTMTVHTRISETDILKVKVGQPLWFYVIADPKRRYESVMGIIQEAPNDALMESNVTNVSAQQSSAVYYNGVFAIANRERLLKTSMTAQVFIITAQAKDVLRIPVAALRQQKGSDRYLVEMLKGNKIESRWVRIGINDSQYAEVKEGLQEEDKVVIAQHSGVGSND